MFPRSPLILLPPSEGKADGGDGPAWQPGTLTLPALDRHRAQALKALGAAMRKPVAQRTKLLGVKGVALAAATRTNLEADQAPTTPAIERYTGVLYDALDVGTLPASSARHLAEQVRILSGLWGVVAPGDAIPDYKLKMGATIGRPGKLSTWWRPAITAALQAETAERTVWDLLPNEHRAAWDPDLHGAGAPAAVISVRFLDEVARPGGTELVAVAHWNKLLKGSLVRHILATQLTDPEGLDDFTHPQGYVHRSDLARSEGPLTRLTFIKPL